MSFEFDQQAKMHSLSQLQKEIQINQNTYTQKSEINRREIDILQTNSKVHDKKIEDDINFQVTQFQPETLKKQKLIYPKECQNNVKFSEGTKGKQFLKNSKNIVTASNLQSNIVFPSKQIYSPNLSRPMYFPPPLQSHYIYQKKYFPPPPLPISRNSFREVKRTSKCEQYNNLQKNNQLLKQDIGILYVQNVHSGMLKEKNFQLAFNQYGNILQIKIDQKKNQAQITFQKKQSVQTILKKKMCLFNRSYIILGKRKKGKIFQELINKRKQEQNIQQQEKQQKIKRFSAQTQRQLKMQLKQLTSQQLRSLYFIEKLFAGHQQILKQVQDEITKIQRFQENLRSENYIIGQRQKKQKNQNQFDWTMIFSYSTDFQVNNPQIKFCFQKIGPIAQSSVQSCLQLLDLGSKSQAENIQQLKNKSRMYLQNNLKQKIFQNRSNQYSENLLQSMSLPQFNQICQNISLSNLNNQNLSFQTDTVPNSEVSQVLQQEKFSQTDQIQKKSIIDDKQSLGEGSTQNYSFNFKNSVSIKFSCPKYAYTLYEWFRVHNLGFQDFQYQIKGKAIRKYFDMKSLLTIQKFQREEKQQRQRQKIVCMTTNQLQDSKDKIIKNQEAKTSNIQYYQSQICQSAAVSIQYNKQQGNLIENQQKRQDNLQNLQDQQNLKENQYIRQEEDTKPIHNQKQYRRQIPFLYEDDEKYKQINSILLFWDQNQNQAQTQNQKQVQKTEQIQQLNAHQRKCQNLNAQEISDWQHQVHEQSQGQKVLQKQSQINNIQSSFKQSNSFDYRKPIEYGEKLGAADQKNKNKSLQSQTQRHDNQKKTSLLEKKAQQQRQPIKFSNYSKQRDRFKRQGRDQYHFNDKRRDQYRNFQNSKFRHEYGSRRLQQNRLDSRNFYKKQQHSQKYLNKKGNVQNYRQYDRNEQYKDIKQTNIDYRPKSKFEQSQEVFDY